MTSENDPTGQDRGGQTGQSGQGGQTQPEQGGQVDGQAQSGQAGQPGQVGQTQPGQGGPGQVQTGPSATDVLRRQDGQAVVKFVVGIFAVVGAGIGLTAVFADALLGGPGTGFLGLGLIVMAYGVAVFGGNILAAVVGLQDFLQIGDVDEQTYLLSFASNAAGFVVMGIIVAFFIAVVVGDGAGSGGGLGDYIFGTIVMAIPAGLVGAGVTWLRDWQPGVAHD